MIGTDNQDVANALTPSFQQVQELNIYTQKAALEWIAKHMKDSGAIGKSLFEEDDAEKADMAQKSHKDGKDKTEMAYVVLRDQMLAHVTPEEHTACPLIGKVRYISIMARRVLDATLYERKNGLVGKKNVANPYLDDRDYYGNKRIEQSGSMIKYLFEDLFKTIN